MEMLREHTSSAGSSSTTSTNSCCCSARESTSTTSTTTAKANTGASDIMRYLTTYRPLIAIGGVALAGGLISTFAAHQMRIEAGMRVAMALSLLPLALLKLFDVRGFAAGFARYDPIAKRIPFYSRVYPFLEAALGLCFLNSVLLVYANLFVLVMFGVNSVGVLTMLRRGDTVTCACVGAGFAIPLGRVTLAEDIFMSGMAALMLAM
jgi:hypothetical protein